MADFKRQGGFGRGGGGNFNRGGGGRRDFGGRGNFRGGRDGGRPQMFSATCASCGKTCEVPFRPTQGKPVYCDDCFRKNKGSSDGFRQREDRGGRDNFPQRDFSSPSRSQSDDRRIDVIKGQLDALDAKVNKIMQVLGVEKAVDSGKEKKTDKKIDKTPLKTIVEDAMGEGKKTKSDKKKTAKKKPTSKKK